MKAHPFMYIESDLTDKAKYVAQGSHIWFEIWQNDGTSRVVLKVRERFDTDGEWVDYTLTPLQMLYGSSKVWFEVGNLIPSIGSIGYGNNKACCSALDAWHLMIKYITLNFKFVPAIEGVNWQKGAKYVRSQT